MRQCFPARKAVFPLFQNPGVPYMLDKMSMRARLTAMVVLALMGFLLVGRCRCMRNGATRWKAARKSSEHRSGRLGIVKHYEIKPAKAKLPLADAQRQRPRMRWPPCVTAR